MSHEVFCIPYCDAIRKVPQLPSFFTSMALDEPDSGTELTVSELLHGFDIYQLEQIGLSREALTENLRLFIESLDKAGKSVNVESVTIIGGTDKGGALESISVRLTKGDVVAIVGPTGSGKSRLLADIEWMAQGDTPTKRRILINDKEPQPEWRYSIEHKLVAQLSQNMNFVMDLCVGDFIELHAQSRTVPDTREKTERILDEANRLAGETIAADMPVTSLSGGQSRALMIADTAFLSVSPIVLIDEIENAGIDRATAVDLLVRKEKIVLIATHDPVLALSAPIRLVIRNGGIAAIIETTDEERECLAELAKMNRLFTNSREILKNGGYITREMF